MDSWMRGPRNKTWGRNQSASKSGVELPSSVYSEKPYWSGGARFSFATHQRGDSRIRSGQKEESSVEHPNPKLGATTYHGEEQRQHSRRENALEPEAQQSKKGCTWLSRRERHLHQHHTDTLAPPIPPPSTPDDSGGSLLFGGDRNVGVGLTAQS